MRRWWLWIALLLSLGINLGVLSILVIHRLTPPRPPGPPFGAEGVPGGMPPGIARLAEHLELDAERKERFLALHREFFAFTRERRLEMASLRRDLRRELSAGSPDRRRVEAILDQMQPLHGDLDRATARLVLDARQLLAPPQQREYLRVLGRLLGDRPPGAGPPGRGRAQPFGGEPRGQ